MSPVDRAVLAERPPGHVDECVAASDASDAVILHLWQATQIVIDLAVAVCVATGAGTPQTYADAFHHPGTAPG